MKKLVLLLLCLGCTAKKEEGHSSDPSVPVTTTHPVVKEVCFSIETLGTLYPNVRAEIFPQMQGHVCEVYVKEGQYVSKGDPLFLIDPTQPRLDLQKAQAELHCVQTEYDAFQKKLVRYSSLAQKDFIAKTEWEELEAQVEKAKHTLSLATLTVQQAQLALDRCEVTAPIDGRVGKLGVAVGLFVGPQTVCTTITQLDPLIVECALTEKELMLLPKNQDQLSVSPLSSPDIVRSGTITFLDSTFDDKRGVILVRGTVRNVDTSTPLYPGQIVLVSIPFKKESKAVLVPQKAIRYSTNGPYVYTVTEDMKVQSCQLVLGEEYGDERVVREGVTADTLLVADGLSRLYAGCSVTMEKQ